LIRLVASLSRVNWNKLEEASVMSKNLFCVLVIATAMSTAAAQEAPPQPAAQQPKMDEAQFAQMVSYALGRSIADDCKMAGVKLDKQAMTTGIGEVEGGKDSHFKPEQLNLVMRQFAMRIQQTIAADNLQRGRQFLTANAEKEGVESTKSGLQYKVVQEGDGETPKPTDLVICHYRGMFVDGQVFESSYDSGQPAQFPANRVIQGWQEALQLMKVGDKYQLFIPAELAYGEEGNVGIGPNEALVFELELLKVVGAGEQAAPLQQ